MKLNISIIAAVAFATVGTIVTAAPYIPRNHGHHHEVIEKRIPRTVTVTTNIVKSTTVAYDVNGHFEPESVVCQGLADGSVVLPTGVNPLDVNLSCSFDIGATRTATPASSAESTKMSTPTATASMIVAAQQSNSASAPVTTSSAAQDDESKTETYYTATMSYSSDSASTTTSLEGQGVDQEFPDEELDCAAFPSDYGAIEIPWMGIGGWSGIQYPIIEGNSVTHIDTAVPGGKNCTAGAMCSYACPAGYQKSQWPSAQGSTGQSVGGLLCNQNNKLTLTNPGLSKNLCIKGTGATMVKNQLRVNAAICRTDYPG